MTDTELTELLFVCDEPASAELAMVFAASNETQNRHRAEKAVQLYRERFADKLLMTGGGTLAKINPEAKRLAHFARQAGVPADDLILEERSANTFHNVEYSREVLQQTYLWDSLTTVLLVSSEWHMRRVLLTVRRFFPGHIRLLCCPTIEGCNRSNWTDCVQCRREIHGEAVLLLGCVESGALPPIDAQPGFAGEPQMDNE